MPWRLVPTSEYMLDRTSPQHQRETLYADIPDGHLVVTAFPILCHWYYGERGTCADPLAINLVADGRPQARTHHRYTGAPYLTAERRESYLADPEIRPHLVVIRDSLTDALAYFSDLIEEARETWPAERKITT